MDDKTKKEILDIKYDLQAIEYLISIMLAKEFYFKHNTRALTVFDEFREEIKDDLINLPIEGADEAQIERFRMGLTNSLVRNLKAIRERVQEFVETS